MFWLVVGYAFHIFVHYHCITTVLIFVKSILKNWNFIYLLNNKNMIYVDMSFSQRERPQRDHSRREPFVSICASINYTHCTVCRAGQRQTTRWPLCHAKQAWTHSQFPWTSIHQRPITTHVEHIRRLGWNIVRRKHPWPYTMVLSTFLSSFVYLPPSTILSFSVLCSVEG